MKNPRKSRKSSKKVIDTKMAAANDKPETPNLTPRLTADEIAAQSETPAAPVSARTAAIRRSQAGKFNKQNLTAIGGKEAPKFYPWTWEQRDKFMASGTPEAQAVKARYEAHLASIKA